MNASPKNWFTRWIDDHPGDGDDSSPTSRGWLVAFLALGFLARAIRYYLCFPLWDDESFLCVNFIQRTFAQLMQPLDYHQVAPILFLWTERAAVAIFGFSEYSLRLVPFACSLVSLVLFYRVARRLVSGSALIFAVAMFAVSYPGIRYAAEAKPYCTDMFVSLGLLSLVLEWRLSRDIRYLAALALLTPLALGFSYPAVFAAGGYSLVVAGILFWTKGSVREWSCWSGWNLVIVASFAVVFLIIGKTQSGAEGEFMGEYWKQNFPPVTNPIQLPLWILKTHASDFLAYPLGGPNWASSATLLLCLIGLWQLVRTRQFVFLGLVLAPASLHFLAAALQRYPYGGHVKFSQYLAPMICCLAAVGIARLIAWHTQWRSTARGKRQGHQVTQAPGPAHRWRPNGYVSAVMLLILIGSGSIVRDLASPYKTRSDFRARALAESFWVGAHYSEEVVCLKSDLGLDFVPDQHRELSWSAQYLCNRAIETSRFRLKPADVRRISATRPLRCVLYHDSRFSLDQTALQTWLAKMNEHYETIGHDSIPLPRLDKNDRRLLAYETIDSYRFIPRENVLPPLAELRHNMTR